MVDVNRLPLQGEGGLIDLLRTLVDPRKPRGVRHPVVTIVALAVCAALSGACSFNAIAEWAQGLSRETLKRLGSKRWKPPSEPTLRRVLQRLDADRLDAQIGQWLAQQHCLAGAGISVDGKTLRGGHDSGQSAPHLLSAILHQEAVVLAQLAVEAKTNEIPKLPPTARSAAHRRGRGHRRCAPHASLHGPLSGRNQKGRLPVHRQRQPAHAASGHRRLEPESVSPLRTLPPIKPTDAWKSARSGPAPN
jgi:DDE family transposase